MALDIVIMAAGKGTRMRSALPKVLHRLGGRPLLEHVLQAAAGLGADRIVVVTGHGAEAVEAACGAAAAPSGGELRFARQRPQLGTGHAVQQALPLLHDAGTTLILNGDVPLLETATARALVDACGGERLALLTFEPGDPQGYGRIVRGAAGTGDRAASDPIEGTVDADPGAEAILGIVEHRDATPAQRAIREVYTGVMAAPTAALRRWLGALGHDNAQGEYYLTDVVAMAVAEGLPVVATRVDDEAEVLGVNSPAQLADLERRHQRRAAARLMDERGVRLADPARFDLRGRLDCGQDVEIDVNCIFAGDAMLGDDVRIGPNCVFEGRVVLGPGVRVGANCMLREVEVGAGAVIHPYTHVDGEALGASVGAGARVGPYARLRPGARLGEEVHVGNFVEVKNATLGRGAKANHLAYLGDASVGERVNFGAGSITANYDGANKHRTTIGDDASIGSNCVLVAPVEVGAGATLGGGSTLAKDAPAGQLTVARARAVSYPNWRRPKKAPAAG